MMIIIICVIFVVGQGFVSGIATSYGLDGPGSIPSRCMRFSLPHNMPGQAWDPQSLLFNGYRRPVAI
jgi:hypothetical protein